jgi:hypothetical protein
MNSKRFFRFSYFHGRNPLLHHQRDADSFIELMPLLIDKGFQYGGIFLNLSSADRVKSVPPEDIPLQKNDVIVLMTRPPLDDEEEGPHLVIRKSGSALEEKIFDSIRKYISVCSRRQVSFHPSLVSQFTAGNEDRSSITFTGHGKITQYFNVARYQATVDSRKRVKQWRQKDGPKTAVYLFNLKEIWEGGPDLLVSFGMTGTCTLIWAYLIRKRFTHFLNAPRIVVAELLIGNIPAFPPDLSFVDDWDIKIVLDHKL